MSDYINNAQLLLSLRREKKEMPHDQDIRSIRMRMQERSWVDKLKKFLKRNTKHLLNKIRPVGR